MKVIWVFVVFLQNLLFERKLEYLPFGQISSPFVWTSEKRAGKMVNFKNLSGYMFSKTNLMGPDIQLR